MSNVISIETIRETAARQRHTKRVVPIHRVARAPRSTFPCLSCQIENAPCSCGSAA